MVGGIENRGESMPKTRKSHPPSLKAKVAVEAIKAHKTAAQIAQMFGVHPTQVGGLEEASAGRSTRHLRQRPRAGAPAVRRRERRAVQTDRPAESGVGLSQKKSWPYRLTTNGNGSIRLTGASAFNSSANCWECRARPTTISRSQRVQKTCDCSASSTNCI